MSRGGHLGSSIYELEPELREISLHLLAGFVLFVKYIRRNLRQFDVSGVTGKGAVNTKGRAAWHGKGGEKGGAESKT